MHTDQTLAADYDDPMSERLLGVAADVLRSFGSAFGGRHLAIVGGVVPGLLVPALPTGIEPHVGTADLDLHLSLHLMDGETAGTPSFRLSSCAQYGAAPGVQKDQLQERQRRQT